VLDTLLRLNLRDSCTCAIKLEINNHMAFYHVARIGQSGLICLYEHMLKKDTK
jgi:hypothetical protein